MKNNDIIDDVKWFYSDRALSIIGRSATLLETALRQIHPFAARVCLIAALAGLLFGLDMAYVNGALDLIAAEFGLDVGQQGSVAACLLVGAAVGALGSGWLSRHHGRRRVLVLAAALFVLATLYTVSARGFAAFLVGRFALGVGMGAASFVAPVYLAEVAPYRVRGSLIATYQLMITVGILLMFASNTALAPLGSWRLMLLVLVVPATVMLLGALTLPESPRWLALVGDWSGAQAVLRRTRRDEGEVAFELDELRQALRVRDAGLDLLSRDYFLKIALLGIALQALQQFCGMNAFMYYSGRVFAAAGLQNPAVGTLLIGTVNVLSTLLAIRWVDRAGRRPILLAGLALLIVACAVVGALLDLYPAAAGTPRRIALVVACLTFIFAFAVSLGPLVWILCSEIMPLEGRDLGVTLSTTANWICNAILGAYSLVWFARLGVGPTFWLFGAVCALGLWLVWRFVPETRGVPLEELELNLKAGVPLRDLGRRAAQVPLGTGVQRAGGAS